MNLNRVACVDCGLDLKDVAAEQPTPPIAAEAQPGSGAASGCVRMPGSNASPCSAVVRRRDRWKHTLNLLETVLTIQRTTLEQIATSGPNSTRDRRNARATIRFVNSLLEKNTQEPPNEKGQR